MRTIYEYQTTINFLSIIESLISGNHNREYQNNGTFEGTNWNPKFRHKHVLRKWKGGQFYSHHTLSPYNDEIMYRGKDKDDDLEMKTARRPWKLRGRRRIADFHKICRNA